MQAQHPHQHSHPHAQGPHSIRFDPAQPFPPFQPPLSQHVWMPSPPPTPNYQPHPHPHPQVSAPQSLPRVMGGITRPSAPNYPPRRASEPVPATRALSFSRANNSARLPPMDGWMLATASHAPGQPHSPHTIQSVDLPVHIVKFIERGFGMRVVRKDGGGVWDLNNNDCQRLLARARMRAAHREEEQRIQAAERGLQGVQLSSPPPTAPRTMPSPTFAETFDGPGSPPPGVLRATRVTRSMSKSKPYDRGIEA